MRGGHIERSFEKDLIKTLTFFSSSSLGATALREPWPPVLFAFTGPYPGLFSDFLLEIINIKEKKRNITWNLYI
jgi:hypothetical protein